MVGLAALCAAVARVLVRSTTAGRGAGTWWTWLKRGHETAGEGPLAGHWRLIAARSSADFLSLRKYGARAEIKSPTSQLSSTLRAALSSSPVVAWASVRHGGAGEGAVEEKGALVGVLDARVLLLVVENQLVAHGADRPGEVLGGLVGVGANGRQ